MCAMKDKTVCDWLKTFAAFAIATTISSVSFAGEFTVHKGKRYRATLSLNSVERLADNALIASKFRALGFSKVRVSGAGAIRKVEGVWPRKDASTPLPHQIIEVASLP
jgi:alpha-L-fucosidase